MTPVAISRPRSAAAVAAAGCTLLALRPLLLRDGWHPTAVLVALFAALLVAGRGWPRAETTRPGAASVPVLAAVAAGLVAFGLGRLAGGGQPPQPLALRVVALGTLAAVAEEAFFRRLVYDALHANGTAVAVLGSAVLFAVVHVSVYGFWVLPIDLAAGLVLSWQRWATGSWAVPAVTHVVANLLVVI